MGKLAISVSGDGIQSISFLCSTDKDRRACFELYLILEEELKVINKLIKENFMTSEQLDETNLN